MNQYLYSKTYNTPNGDLVQLILTNALNVNLVTISESAQDLEFESFMNANTGDEAAGELLVYKLPDHYDSIIPKRKSPQLHSVNAWWRHKMETFSALLAICVGNSPVPVNSSQKGQWCGAFVFSLVCVWIISWVNNHEAGDLRRYRIHYDVTVKDYDDDELDITDEPSYGRHQTPGNESSLHTQIVPLAENFVLLSYTRTLVTEVWIVTKRGT